MIERVIFTPEADDDVAESYDWYERCEPGLGEDFLRCIEACVLSIQRHPLMFQVAIDAFRRTLIRRFPYELFYEPTADSIISYSVFHCSQDPQKWRKIDPNDIKAWAGAIAAAIAALQAAQDFLPSSSPAEAPLKQAESPLREADEYFASILEPYLRERERIYSEYEDQRKETDQLAMMLNGPQSLHGISWGVLSRHGEGEPAGENLPG